MVKIKDEPHIKADGSIDLEEWLKHLETEHHYHSTQLIRNACVLSQLAGSHHATDTGESCLQQGLATAELLVDLDLDQETIAAAIVQDTVQFADLTVEDIEEQLGPQVGKLVAGVERMSELSNLRGFNPATANPNSIDNIRKMLLAMVDDVRVVLIKLADHLVVLRAVANLDDKFRRRVASETMQVYAPLANRLGLGAMKWEMEDLAFRILEPEQYKSIAKSLKARRVDRDRYKDLIVTTLKQALHDAGIQHAKISGRSKHIHSIYRKMQRKKVTIENIFDATAVRILVDNIEDCYHALGVVHHLWTPIKEEYDDYIIQPKENGYASLHTAVVGPEDKIFEVQIRTYEMHSAAELGVAAHWAYKEGAASTQSAHERKIAWLRDVMSWHREMAHSAGVPEELENQFLDDRIYVFTPNGDLVELPHKATPLDFAYQIHSQIGHRCRGAKVHGHIVPLTHTLKTGDQVEIITTREPKPSRDWINPNAGYLHTSRARAKVLHWFKQQNFAVNKKEGEDILEHELKKLHLPKPNIDELAKQFNLKTGDDFLAALGRGDIRLTQLIHRIAPVVKAETEIPALSKSTTIHLPGSGDVNVAGVGNLLTHYASCCHPVPGDPIIGYITIGHGISIHRQDCSNIHHLEEAYHERLLPVSWGEHATKVYPVTVNITASDRSELIHDITQLFSAERIRLNSMNTHSDHDKNTIYLKLTLQVSSLSDLSKILDKIKLVNGVLDVHRVE